MRLHAFDLVAMGAHYRSRAAAERGGIPADDIQTMITDALDVDRRRSQRERFVHRLTGRMPMAPLRTWDQANQLVRAVLRQRAWRCAFAKPRQPEPVHA
jgi:hypothetical protein